MTLTNEANELEQLGTERVSRVVPKGTTRGTVQAAACEYRLLVPRTSTSPLLRQAYEVWRNGWQETLRTLTGIKSIHSDEFERQHEIGVLTVRGTCVSVTGLRWLDISQPMAREDSYFASWPEPTLQRLQPGRVGVSSNTIVDPHWRRTLICPSNGEQPNPLALVTVALTLKRFLESSAELFVGTARNDRSMNRVGTDIGGTKIGQLQVHGIDSDIILQTRSDTPRLGAVVEELWGRRRQ